MALAKVGTFDKSARHGASVATDRTAATGLLPASAACAPHATTAEQRPLVTLAEFVDIGFLVVAIVGPVLLVLRSERWGVLLGAAFAWLVLIVAGDVLAALDPARDAAMGDSIWVLFGWVGTLAYSSLVSAAVRIVRALRSRRTDGSRADGL